MMQNPGWQKRYFSHQERQADTITKGDTVLITKGAGTGIRGIVTSIQGDKITVTNLFKGSFQKDRTEVEKIQT